MRLKATQQEKRARNLYRQLRKGKGCGGGGAKGRADRTGLCGKGGDHQWYEVKDRKRGNQGKSMGESGFSPKENYSMVGSHGRCQGRGLAN